MNRQPAMNKVRELANQFIQQGNPTGWFETLYSQAKGDTSQIPWADLVVNSNLSEWLEKNQMVGARKKALVSVPSLVSNQIIKTIVQYLARQGTMLIICRGRKKIEQEARYPPYALTQEELAVIEGLGLKKVTS